MPKRQRSGAQHRKPKTPDNDSLLAAAVASLSASVEKLIAFVTGQAASHIAAPPAAKQFESGHDQGPTLIRRQPQAQPPPPAVKKLPYLTPRQQEVGRLILQGFTLKQIAARWDKSEQTAKTHRTALYAKLGISAKHELEQFRAQLLEGHE